MQPVSNFCKWTFIGGLSCACGSGAPASEALGSRTSALDLANAELGPAFGTDLPVAVASEYGHSPSVAFDGENYAVAFEDAGRIRAVRVTPEGRVLDLEWLDFGVDDQVQLYPDIAYGGGKYLVSWSEIETGELRGQMFLPDGSIPDSESIALSDEGMYPDAVFDGENFLVAFWNLEASARDVSVMRVSPEGERIANSEHPVSASGKGGIPSLARGAISLVAWEDASSSPSTIHAARIGNSGDVLDAGGFRVSDSTLAEHSAAVAALGDNFLVAYHTETTPQSIRGIVVDAQRQLNTPSIEISHSSADAVQPAVTADADAFLVTWFLKQDITSVYGVRVPASGGPIDTTDRRFASGEARALSSSEKPALVAGADQFLIAFEGSLGVQGNLLDQALELGGDDFALSAVANKQVSQQVSWNGQSYVISWVDERRGEDVEDLEGRAVRIDDEGELLDSEALLLTDPGAFSVTHASGSGGSWLTAWYSTIDGRAYVRAVTADGTLGSARVFSERSVSTAPALSSNGDGYFATSVINETGNLYSVYGTLIDAAGVPGAEFPIVSMLDQPPANYVFNHGEDYWVAVSSTNDVKLYPVSAGGSVGAPLTLASTRAFVAAASSGEQLLVAWIDPSSAVSARRLSAGAFAGDVIPLSATSTGFLPAVSFDGDNFLVAWDEMEPRVLKARTLTSEDVASPVRTLLNEECVGPSLASNGAGQTLVSCLRYGENAMTRRVVSYFVGDVPENQPQLPTGGRSGQGGAAPSGGRTGNSSGGVDSGSGGSRGGTPAVGPGGEAGNAEAGESNDGGEPAASSGANAGGASSGGRANARGGSSAGTPNAAGGSAPVQNSESDGCSCSVPRSGAGNGWLAFVTLAVGLAARRIARRRARR